MAILEEHLTSRLLQEMDGTEGRGMTWQLYSLISQLERFWQQLQQLDGLQARDMLLDLIFQLRME